MLLFAAYLLFKQNMILFFNFGLRLLLFSLNLNSFIETALPQEMHR